MLAIFDHEKLDVYQLQLEFITWLAALLTHVNESNAPLQREVVNQIDRASISTLLNTAEGNAKRSFKLKCKFFDDARGSAIKCAACLDVMQAKGFVEPGSVVAGKQMLARVVAMLSRLLERFEVSLDEGRVREEVEAYGTEELRSQATEPATGNA